MEETRQRLSTAVDAWRRSEARGLVDRWERPREAETFSAVAAAHRWLASDEAAELVPTLAADDEAGALAAHVARCRAERALAAARDQLVAVRASDIGVNGVRTGLADAVRELVREPARVRRESLLVGILPAAGTAAQLLVDARRAADTSAMAVLDGAPPRPDRGATADELAAEARALLAATADPARELLAWALSKAGGDVHDPSVHDVVHALARAEGTAVLGARERLRRLGALLAPSGLERTLSSRVRVHLHGGLDRRARVATVAPPLDVHLGLPADEPGVLAELAVADGVGRALALSLASPALPPALRRPLDASVSRSLGALVAALATTAPVLRRTFELSARDTDSLTRYATLARLLDLRLHAGALLARRGPDESDGDVLRDALGARVPAELAVLLVRTPAAHAARFRGRRGALALQIALREKLDVDWHRNPRTGETLRALCERAGGLSIEQGLKELGVDAAPASLLGAAELTA